ncbi:hypothetical protein [Bacillus amyloliquefaciens]|uniref:hypothetical protein n=1 Tax=Bacillus amyloliquefaciens TaxID=1390 RepID=UPI002808F6A7|nr:hypothetical protein [Bacillus amyloliquefaciens]MDQ8094210.1 hypothetical protein [Bacillus amyloliquefaciens]
MSFKKGVAALGSLNSSNEGGSKKSEIKSFKSGDTLKVRVNGPFDLMEYYAYGIFGKVNTFVPKNPAERNEKGFITSGETCWDRASQYYYDLAKTDKANEQDLKNLGYQFRGKQRYLMGFTDLETGEQIVVDLTKPQTLGVYETILEYSEKDKDGNAVDGGEHEFHDMAFKLAKKGSGTATSVTLTPIINIAKGLSDEEKANFEASSGKEFDTSMFDGVLYEMDEEEMSKSLVKADFDISLLGLTIGGSADSNEPTSEELPF